MASNSSPHTPRIITYAQNHVLHPNPQQYSGWTLSNIPSIQDRWISLLRLTEHDRRVTHIIIGQWWWAPDRNKNRLFLNDDYWEEPEAGPYNPSVMAEVKELQARGVKVLAQLTFFWKSNGFGADNDPPDSDNNPTFDHLYGLLSDMLKRSKLDGVDLDVEDHATDNLKVSKLIRRLRKDFGKEFLITMAPGGDELKMNVNGLSDIKYPQLYKEIGDEISWFNIQNYNGWGSLTLNDFESFLRAGASEVDAPAFYPVDKLVMNVCVNTENGDDWTSGEDVKAGLRDIHRKYPNMGGICCWEFYNAAQTELEMGWPVFHPELWFDMVREVLFGERGK